MYDSSSPIFAPSSVKSVIYLLKSFASILKIGFILCLDFDMIITVKCQ